MTFGLSGTDSLKIDSAGNFKHQISVTYTDQIKNLPLVITKTNIDKPDTPVALLISGDGGWYSFEQSIANHLAEEGIPTVGLDSRKYFWNRKTPEETASDISKALEYYSKEWGRNRFLFVGYSLGAEIIPFIANRVFEDIRFRIVSSLLLSPETTTDFEIHISNMLGMGNSQNTYNVMNEIYRMQSIHTLVIFGEAEKTTVPELLSKTSVTVRLIPGDHHYKSNVQLIMKTMKENKVF